MSNTNLPQTHGELTNEGWLFLNVRCLTCGHTADISLMDSRRETRAKKIGATASRIVCRICKDNDLYARNLEFTLVRPELTGSHYDTMCGRPVEFIGGKLVSRGAN
jgi:hypothetical protein